MVFAQDSARRSSTACRAAPSPPVASIGSAAGGNRRGTGQNRTRASPWFKRETRSPSNVSQLRLDGFSGLIRDLLREPYRHRLRPVPADHHPAQTAAADGLLKREAWADTEYVKENPDELHALAQDALIRVTRFFRDPRPSSLEPESVPGSDPADTRGRYVGYGCPAAPPARKPTPWRSLSGGRGTDAEPCFRPDFRHRHQRGRD